MEFTASTPTADITIGGAKGILVPQPFAKGPQDLSEGAANSLNQTVCENVRNNCRVKVQEMVEQGKPAKEIQAYVTDYCKTYEFGKRAGGGSRASDPVEAESMDIARKKVKRACLKKGISLKDVSASDITKYAKALLEHKTYGPQIRAEAEQNVKDRDKDMDKIVGALNIGG